MEMKEQSACALWALAGSSRRQQRLIAERIGVSQLMDMLLLASEKLQHVGQFSSGRKRREFARNIPIFL